LNLKRNEGEGRNIRGCCTARRNGEEGVLCSIQKEATGGTDGWGSEKKFRISNQILMEAKEKFRERKVTGAGDVDRGAETQIIEG